MVLWAGVLNLLLFVPFGSFDFGRAEQLVFEAKPRLNESFLARFHVDATTPLSSQKILEVAEVYDLDVWHATDQLVDIYTSSLPSELQEIPYSVVSVPPVHSPHSSQHPTASSTITDPPTWNLSSLYTPFHDTYHPLDEIYTFFDQLVAQFPDVTRVMEMGRSAEGRRIMGVSLSTGGYGDGGSGRHGERGRTSQEDEGDEQAETHRKKKKKDKKSRRPPLRDTEKLGFVIIGAQHAREWIATSTAIYLAQSLLVNHTEPNSLHKLLDHFDFHFVPVPNPDGYAYTWQTDRYWYKNRQVVGPYTRCVGVDMNRNWGYKWRSKVTHFSDSDSDSDSPSNQTSHHPILPADPCSHWYPGSRPFESPEVNSIANWVTTLPNLAAFIDLRSYGQMISSPFSFSCTPIPRDLEDQTEAALGSSQALSSAHGTSYKVGKLCETLYPAPGNVLDWMYVRESVKYGYVVHLRDTGTYGFSLPEKWIRPTGEETNRMVNYLSRFIARQANRKLYLPPKKNLN